MTKKPRDNKVGPWAEEKLKSLERALDYYTTFLKNQPHWEKVYIDAFAGPGLSAVRSSSKENVPSFADDLFGQPADPVEEQVKYLKGSPRVALDLKNPFDRYIFIEKDRQRLRDLNALKTEYGDSRKIEIKPGDANHEVLAILESGISKRTHRGYAFLDPFGLQMPWSTIERIAQTGAIEVMINFPMGTTIRRMIPNHGDVPPGWRISLTTFFGSPDWESHVYEEVDGLLGKRNRKFSDSEVRLLDWYRGRLRQAFGHVSEAQLITNTGGGRLYYLIWAGPHAAGLKGANYILTMKNRLPAKRGHPPV